MALEVQCRFTNIMLVPDFKAGPAGAVVLQPERMEDAQRQNRLRRGVLPMGKAQRRRVHGPGTMTITESQRKPLVLRK